MVCVVFFVRFVPVHGLMRLCGMFVMFSCEDVRYTLVGCLNVFVCFNCCVVVYGLWFGLFCVCACWLYVFVCFVCDRLCGVE